MPDALIMVLMLVGLGLLFTALWCVHDAFEHTDMGWVWLFLFLGFFPLAVPAYLIMRAYANRGPNAAARAQMLREDSLVPKFRFANEIERARFIEAAEKGHGTMYEPDAGLGIRVDGYPHFTDQKAETLIGAHRYEEAWQYLVDIYDVAQKESDPVRLDTYRHYISRLPDGIERLRAMQAAAERDPDRPAERKPAERRVPF